MKRVKDDVVYVLKKVDEDEAGLYTEYDGVRFGYPRRGKVEAPDWKADKKCGHGLHGLEWGCGDFDIDIHGDRFMVLKVRKSDGYVDLSNKVKFRKGDVVMVTKESSKAIEYIKRKAAEHGVVLEWVNYDYSTDKVCHQGHDSASAQRDYSTSMQGNRSTSMQGYRGTSTQRDYSTSMQGNWSTNRQGFGSTSRQGFGSTSRQGFGSTSRQGFGSTSIQEFGSTSTQGYRSTSNQGNGGVSIIHGDSHVYRALGTKSCIVMFPDACRVMFPDVGGVQVYKQGWDYEKNETVYITDGKITKRYTGVGKITKLEDHEVFVFGSNMAGKHSGGAAKTAVDKFGAEDGVGEGLSGQSYAFPTLDRDLKRRSTEGLRYSVAKLVKCACGNPTKIFLLTKVGCGIAGYQEDDMKKLFDITKLPANIVLPKDWYTN